MRLSAAAALTVATEATTILVCAVVRHHIRHRAHLRRAGLVADGVKPHSRILADGADPGRS